MQIDIHIVLHSLCLVDPREIYPTDTDFSTVPKVLMCMVLSSADDGDGDEIYNLCRLDTKEMMSLYPHQFKLNFIQLGDWAKIHNLSGDLERRKLTSVDWDGEYQNWSYSFPSEVGQQNVSISILHSNINDIELV